MSRLRAAAAAVALALAAAGCAPEAGTVVSRRYQPASAWTTTVCTGSGTTASPRRCHPETRYDPERYLLELDDGERRGHRPVSPHEYQQCPPGSRFPECAAR